MIIHPRLTRLLCAGALGLAGSAGAASLAPAGCPVAHCTPEGNGVMGQPVVTSVSTVVANNTLGDPQWQGCSGDGLRIACLFSTDASTGTAAGTLKLLDATTLQPLWGSAGVAGSYNLIAAGVSKAQAPVLFANGRVAAGDNTAMVLYAADGQQVAKALLTSPESNFGLTPISDTRGIVAQGDGTLTLIDLDTWQVLGSLQLRDPVGNVAVKLAVPPVGSGDVLYALAGNVRTGRSYLFAVAPGSSQPLRVRWTFSFTERPPSAAVVVKPAVTGLPGNLVLVNVPSLPGDTQPQPRIVALVDQGGTFSTAWTLPLAQSLPVAPTVDEAARTLYFGFPTDAVLRQHDLLSGAARAQFDLRAITGQAPGFVFNGHFIASQAGGRFTLLLTALQTAATRPANGQYAMAFSPGASPGQVDWIRRIGSRAEGLTASWSLAPAAAAGQWCPLVVGSRVGIVRLCDF